MLSPPLNSEALRRLFSKPYGTPGPTPEQWRAVYAEDVLFVDPTQVKQGIDAYIRAQDGLMKRCDDVFLESESVAVDGDVAFVEWRMGLKIKGIEFIYRGATRLVFGSDGRITNHRDYFDFVAPTFGPVPVLGPFVRWVYQRFVS